MASQRIFSSAWRLETDEEDVVGIADAHGVGVLELIGGDGAGALAADVDEDLVAALAGHFAFDDGARGGDAVLPVERGEEFVVTGAGLLDRLLRFADSHLAVCFLLTGALPSAGRAGLRGRGVVKRPVVDKRPSPNAGKGSRMITHPTPPRKPRRSPRARRGRRRGNRGLRGLRRIWGSATADRTARGGEITKRTKGDTEEHKERR